MPWSATSGASSVGEACSSGYRSSLSPYFSGSFARSEACAQAAVRSPASRHVARYGIGPHGALFQTMTGTLVATSDYSSSYP